jgi:hypothetical protein
MNKPVQFHPRHPRNPQCAQKNGVTVMENNARSDKKSKAPVGILRVAQEFLFPQALVRTRTPVRKSTIADFLIGGKRQFAATRDVALTLASFYLLRSRSI